MDADIACSISRFFGGLPDPRSDHALRHGLLDIVTIAICAVVASADDWEAVAAFGEANEEWFGTFLELPNGIPSHDTFWRVFRALDADQFEACFSEWTSGLRKLFAGEVVAIDGKALRRSHDRCHGVEALHLVSAWATRNGLLLGQLNIDVKENEIVAVPELLKQIDVTDCLVTADALNCQVKTADTILERGGDYLLALKQNQPTLHEEVSLLFSDLAASLEAASPVTLPVTLPAPSQAGSKVGGKPAYPHNHARIVNAGHGRIETRQAWVISDPEWVKQLPSVERWPKLVSLVKVEAVRRFKGTDSHSTETRYYVSSADLSAADAINATRTHWQIENSLHWVLDIAFREDDARVRKDNGAENFAILRRIALSVIKQDKTSKLGVKNKRLQAAWDHDYMLHLLSLMTN